MCVRRLFPFLLLNLLLLLPLPAGAIGLLVPSEEGLAPLRLVEQQVEVTLEEHAAVTHITQVFHNRTDRMLEATYLFALPEGAATTEFALWMNGERVVGRVLDRMEARRTYEGIVRRMQDPGLLEYVDRTLFQARIFPIPPRGEQRVEIEYASVVPQTGGDLHYTLPLHPSMGATLDRFTFSLRTVGGTPVQRMWSPRHVLDEVREPGRGLVRVTHETSQASTAAPLEVFITRSQEDVGFSLLSWDPDDGEDGYFMLTLSPSEELAHLEVLPKQVTFVVDVSGSMAGVKMDQARATLRHCVQQLRPDDTFNLVSFSTGVSEAFASPRRADRDAVREALTFIDGLQARGNTNISAALERALRDPASPDRPHVIFFLTDGLPTEGERDISRLVQLAGEGVSDGDRRIYAFGVGYDVNTRLLDGMARRGRGSAGYVRPEEDISDVVGGFFARIGDPLLTRLTLDFGALEVDRVYPQPLPDLYRGGQVTVFGRYRGGASDWVQVLGDAGSERITLRRGVDLDAAGGQERAWMGHLWAQRRIDALLDLHEQGQGHPGLEEEVRALAMRWNIVTPWTSYLTVEPGMDRDAVAQRPFPRPVPRSTGAVSRGAASQAGPAPAPRVAADEPEISLNAAMRSNAPGVGGLGAGSGSGQGEAPVWAGRSAEVGRAAVEESIARRAQAESRQVAPTQEASVRSAGGRTFVSVGGRWQEQGTEQATVQRTVVAFSDAYFALLEQNPSLRDVLSLGVGVRFRHQGQVWEVRGS
jgi:Ca-activated chloride channel family protein